MPVIHETMLWLEVLLKIFSAYFVIIMAFALLPRRKIKPAPPRTKFAVLIPARNEAAVIGALVESLFAQNYPREMLDVFVIPNNCTDGGATEQSALAAGAKIFSPRGYVRYKGDALRQAFESLKDSGCDAFCVFDSDNYVDPNFLAEMNNAFCGGAKICKSQIKAKNPYDSAIAGTYAIYFETFNLLFNRARDTLGLSAKIVGTGFAIRADVLERLGGFNTETIAEDTEFGVTCAVAGERVTFVPRAITWDEEPNSFAASLTQRKCWCSGIMDVCRVKLRGIVSAPKKARRLSFDTAMIILSPFVQATAIAPLVYDISRAIAVDGAWAEQLIGLAASYAGVLLFGAALAFLGGYRDRRILKGIAMFPIFMASWLPLQVLCVFRRTTAWREMRHTGARGYATRVKN